MPDYDCPLYGQYGSLLYIQKAWYFETIKKEEINQTDCREIN